MTLSERDVLIVGLGATTSIGRTAWASAAAVRGGLSGFTQHAFMIDTAGEPMHIAPLPWIDQALGIVDRVVESLIATIREALAPLREAEPLPPMALLVNLPSARPALPQDLVPRIEERLHEEFAGVFEHIRIMPLGHAGGFVALDSVLQALERTPQTVCVIAGADSYVDADMLEWLEATDQLHGAGTRNNAWGFVPGEGAGAVLLASPQTARRHTLVPLGRVRGVGLGRETQLIGTGTVCTGLGLTEAVRGALTGLPDGERVTDVYCDMNGEAYRADEFGFFVTRTRDRFVAASDFVAPADCWGDIGAASGPLCMALACIAGSKGYSRGRVALVWASSVEGERGAALIETAGPR